jgi:hypothetical protein
MARRRRKRQGGFTEEIGDRPEYPPVQESGLFFVVGCLNLVECGHEKQSRIVSGMVEYAENG